LLRSSLADLPEHSYFTADIKGEFVGLHPTFYRADTFHNVALRKSFTLLLMYQESNMMRIPSQFNTRYVCAKHWMSSLVSLKDTLGIIKGDPGPILGIFRDGNETPLAF
jgi:hypothetical protein